MTTIVNPPAVLVSTFPPTRRIVAKEIHGDRAAAKLGCGHLADVAADRIVAPCVACPPLELRRPAEVPHG